MEVTKCAQLPESLAFKARHPEKLHVFLHIRENIAPASEAAADAWMHLCNSLAKLLRQTARLELMRMTQPLAVMYLLLHAT